MHFCKFYPSCLYHTCCMYFIIIMLLYHTNCYYYSLCSFYLMPLPSPCHSGVLTLRSGVFLCYTVFIRRHEIKFAGAKKKKKIIEVTKLIAYIQQYNKLLMYNNHQNRLRIWQYLYSLTDEYEVTIITTDDGISYYYCMCTCTVMAQKTSKVHQSLNNLFWCCYFF